jgi:hypothetical protein
MLDGVMLLWFILVGVSVLFVAIDIWRTPEATALRWGFIILTVFSGPLGAFFYVLGCREPFPGAHERYVAPTWKQVLGSTMHCASGDGLGIILGAAIGFFLTLPMAADIGLEYALGFGFGWLFFQAFAMRDMAGGNYRKSLKMTFIPEFFSMNVLMAGMTLLAKFWMPHVDGSTDPLNPAFWFIMSMALIAGFICAFPMNWWLVTRHLKHGMMTVRAAGPGNEHAGHDMADMAPASEHAGHDMAAMAPASEHAGHDMASGMEHAEHSMKQTPPASTIVMVGTLSAAILAIGIALVLTLA